VLASIDHTARSLQVESIAERVSQLTIHIARQRYPLLTDGRPAPPATPDPPADAFVVRAHRTGWVQQLSLEAVAGAVPDGTTAVLALTVGDHVAEGDPVAHLWPSTPDPKRAAHILDEVIDLGPTRTMQDDVGFGIIQLVDIAARALSPAINDPYTAQEIVLRLTPILRELLTRDLVELPVRRGDRHVFPAPGWTVEDHLDLAIGSLRWHAREQPRVLTTLIEQLGDLRRVAADPAPVEHQAEVLLAELHRLAPADADAVRRAAARAGWPDQPGTELPSAP
jgi:uncharacterized membrane protein